MNETAYIIPRDRIPAVWAQIAPVLQPAVFRSLGEFDMGQLRQLLVLGRAKLVVFGEEMQSALVVEFIDYPAYRVANIIVAAGDGLTANEQGWADLKKWLVGEGCKHVQASCDISAARLFKRIGMETVYSVVRGDL